jgi:hypothetical protein
MSLDDVRYDRGRMRYQVHHHREAESALAGYIDAGRRVLASLPDGRPVEPHRLTEDFEALRWFWLPEELAAAAARDSQRGAPTAV